MDKLFDLLLAIARQGYFLRGKTAGYREAARGLRALIEETKGRPFNERGDALDSYQRDLEVRALAESARASMREEIVKRTRKLAEDMSSDLDANGPG